MNVTCFKGCPYFKEKKNKNVQEGKNPFEIMVAKKEVRL